MGLFEDGDDDISGFFVVVIFSLFLNTTPWSYLIFLLKKKEIVCSKLRAIRWSGGLIVCLNGKRHVV